jgi:CelD/BcsL family acetyltransferase involved in cellulose biosynthesis
MLASVEKTHPSRTSVSPLLSVNTPDARLESATRRAPGTVPRVEVLRTGDDLHSIQAIWESLRQHPNADIDALELVIRSSPSMHRPHVLALCADSGPEAILTGFLEDRLLETRFGYLHLPAPRLRTTTFMHGGLLGAPDAAGYEALAGQIAETLCSGEADAAFFNHLRADSPLFTALFSGPSPLLRDRSPLRQIHRRATLPGSYNDFLARLSPKTRRNLRWVRNKMEKSFSSRLAVQCLRGVNELDSMVSHMETIAATAYQRGLGVGFADTPAHRARLQFRAERGWLRTYVLLIDGKPAAFFSGTLSRDIFYGDYMGYDAAYAQYSPGMYLVTQMIEDLCCGDRRDRASAIDFGLGDAPYKAAISDQSWEDVTFWLFAPTLRNRLIHAWRTPLLAADAMARTALGAGLQGRVKRIWRNRVAPKRD